MQTPAKWMDFPKYPVVTGTMLLACAATIAWWSHFDLTVLTVGPDVQRGQLWRLFTGIFLHVDILHLLFNLYWLWMFGTLLERTFGHARTAFIVILLAIGSSAFEFALDRGGVGLSGVGYGLFGMVRNDNVAALRWLNDAARLEPRSAYIWYDLGIAHARQGDLAAAKAAYQKAHDLDPVNSDYAKALAEAQ